MSSAEIVDPLEPLGPKAATEFDELVRSYDDLAAPFDRVVGTMREYLPPRPVRRTEQLTAMSGLEIGRDQLLELLAGPTGGNPFEDGVVEVTRRIEACVVGRRAGSFLRLGDGEGNLLALGLGQYPALTAHCAEQVLRYQLGGDDFSSDERAAILAAFHQALRGADVLGLPNRGNLTWLMRRYPQVDARGTYGIASVFAYLERHAEDLHLAEKAATASRFSSDLLPYYRGLVEGRDVGFVTCRPQLGEALTRRWGAASVTLHDVPGHAGKTSTKATTRTSHYPERYLELREELRGSVRPGMLYLVAAGILAKVYCEVIRASGGVAVDIGAVADTWAGIRSRVYMDPAYLRAWSITGADAGSAG